MNADEARELLQESIIPPPRIDKPETWTPKQRESMEIALRLLRAHLDGEDT